MVLMVRTIIVFKGSVMAILKAVLGYKGNMASAKAARQMGEYNAKVAENEQVLIQRATRQKEKNLFR